MVKLRWDICAGLVKSCDTAAHEGQGKVTSVCCRVDGAFFVCVAVVGRKPGVSRSPMEGGVSAGVNRHVSQQTSYEPNFDAQGQMRRVGQAIRQAGPRSDDGARRFRVQRSPV